MADVAAVTRAGILGLHGESDLNVRIEARLNPQFRHQFPERAGWVLICYQAGSCNPVSHVW